MQALALGIDLGGTKVEARLFGADGQELWRERAPTPPLRRYRAGGFGFQNNGVKGGQFVPGYVASVIERDVGLLRRRPGGDQ